MGNAARDPLETSLLFDVFAVNQAVGRLLDEAMRDGPLSPTEYAVYSAIFELESATPTQLAARLGMRLTTFLDKLRLVEARGHGRRVAHPSDRRSYRIVLTSSGMEAHQQANRQFELAAEAFQAHLRGSETAAKAALLEVRRAADAASGAVDAGEAAAPRRPEPEPSRLAGSR